MLGVEALIVFAVASFHIAVVPRRICTDLLMLFRLGRVLFFEQRHTKQHLKSTTSRKDPLLRSPPSFTRLLPSNVHHLNIFVKFMSEFVENA